MEIQRPVQCIDHESEHGRWTLWRRPPTAALAPYVSELQGYLEESDLAVTRTELPVGIVPLIIVLDHGFVQYDPSLPNGRRPLGHAFVAGLHCGPATIGSNGRSLCLQVDLTPLGARRLLRMDLDVLADQVVDLAAISPRFADTLEGRLRDAGTWEQRFAILEAALADRILTAPAGDRRLAAAWHAIRRSDGRVRIDALAGSLDISRKHLNAIFRQQLGLSPKTCAGLVRFASAVEAMQNGALASGTLADLAARCGYADQSHFNRDFSVFAGESPRSLMARMMPDGTGIMAG